MKIFSSGSIFTLGILLLLQACNSKLEIEDFDQKEALNATVTRSSLETISNCNFTNSSQKVSAGSIEFKLVFNQEIRPSSFTIADITNAGTGGGSGLTWAVEDCGDNKTFKISASGISGDGTIVPTVTTGSIISAIGKTNGTSIGTEESQVSSLDTVAPSVTINKASDETVGTCEFTAPSDPTNTFGFSYRVTFSEAIDTSSFITSDITNTGTGGAGLLAWSITNCGDDKNFMLTSTALTGAGTIIPVIGASKVTDVAGNNNTISTTTDSTITIETTAPTVTINQATTQTVGTCSFTAPNDPSFSTGFEFKVTFSEAINASTFTTADISNGGSGGATLLTWSLANCGDDTNFKLTASSITGYGTIVPNLLANLVKDPAGNNNTASTSADNSVEYKLLSGGDPMSAIKVGGTTTAGGTGVYHVARASDDSFVVGGYFVGTRNLGGADLVAAAEDGYVVKYNSSGAHVWSTKFGGTGQEIMYRVAVDSNKDVYIIGYTKSTAAWTVGGACGNNMATTDGGGGPSIVLVKFNGTNGACIWSKLFGTFNWNYGQAVAAGADGTIVIAVACSSTLDFGSGVTISCDGGQRETVLVKLNQNDGSVVWAKRFNSSAVGAPHDMAEHLAVDSNGDIYLSGWMNGTITPQAAVHPLGTYADAYGALGGAIDTADTVVWRLNSNGVVQWGRRIGSASTNDLYTRLAVDSNGDVVMIGTFAGATMNFVSAMLAGITTVDGALLVQAAGTNVVLTGRNAETDMYVAKLRHADGGLMWARLGTDIGNAGSIIGWAIDVDSADNVIVSGTYSVPTLDGLWSSALTNLSAGTDDIFISKFDQDGAYVWAKTHGTTVGEGGPFIFVDTNDDIVMTGVYAATINFGLGNLTTANSDLYIVKFSQ